IGLKRAAMIRCGPETAANSVASMARLLFLELHETDRIDVNGLVGERIEIELDGADRVERERAGPGRKKRQRHLPRLQIAFGDVPRHSELRELPKDWFDLPRIRALHRGARDRPAVTARVLERDREIGECGSV